MEWAGEPGAGGLAVSAALPSLCILNTTYVCPPFFAFMPLYPNDKVLFFLGFDNFGNCKAQEKGR